MVAVILHVPKPPGYESPCQLFGLSLLVTKDILTDNVELNGWPRRELDLDWDLEEVIISGKISMIWVGVYQKEELHESRRKPWDCNVIPEWRVGEAMQSKGYVISPC